MAQVCELTGKKAMGGNNVSHAMNKTKRKFKVNLTTKRFYIPEEDRWITLRVSTNAIKTVNAGLFGQAAGLHIVAVAHRALGAGEFVARGLQFTSPASSRRSMSRSTTGTRSSSTCPNYCPLASYLSDQGKGC